MSFDDCRKRLANSENEFAKDFKLRNNYFTNNRCLQLGFVVGFSLT